MRILLVEDELKIAAFIKRGLEENAYIVDVVHDGQAGLDCALGYEYDLIILDLILPKLDGIALCRNLRQMGNETAILILTAKDTVDDRVDGLDAGADDYLAKPFAFRELLARLRALSRRNTHQRKSILEVGDLKLDLVTHQAERAGQTIDLSAKEFALLELFMRHPQQLLTRKMIAEHLWDYGDTQEFLIFSMFTFPTCAVKLMIHLMPG